MTDQHHQEQEPQGKLDQARETAGQALETARDAAGKAAQQTAATLESNPVGVIVGGLALGAIVAAVLPRSAREKEMLAPVGRRIGATVTAAIAAAKDAGRQELDEVGLTRSSAQDRVHSLFEGVIKAASSAGSAAISAGKDAARPQ